MDVTPNDSDQGYLSHNVPPDPQYKNVSLDQPQ